MSRDYMISDFVRIKNNQIFNSSGTNFYSEKNKDLSVFLKDAYSGMEIAYPKFHKMDSLCKMGILASESLFRDRNINPDTALVFSNSASSMETDLKHHESLDDSVSPAIFVYTLPNIVIGEISIKYQLQTENAFFISEGFDPVLLKDYSTALLQKGKAQELVCGWIEWKNDEYDVFLCLISRKGNLPFTEENLEELYRFENE